MPSSPSPSANRRGAERPGPEPGPGRDTDVATLRRRFVETARRAEVVGLINAAGTEAELGLRFAEELCEIFGAEVAFVLDGGPRGYPPRCAAAVGLSTAEAEELLADPVRARTLDGGKATVVGGDDVLGIGARTAVLAPFSTEGGRGVLVGVARLYEREFDEADRALVEAVTLAAGHALERIWAYEERDRRAEEQAALVRAAKSLGGSLETSEVLNALCAEVRRALDCDTVAACLGDEIDGYVTTGTAGLPDSFMGFRQPPGTGLGGHAVRAGRTMVTHDYQGEGYSPPETTALAQVVSSLATPINWEDRARGFLSVGFTRDRRIEPNDIQLVEGFAELAGQACANAARHADVRDSAELDSLTGCLNRTALDRRLGELVRAADASGEPLSLALLDLDEFKSINDIFGHPAGDGVLRRVGSALRAGVRGGDLVCRYGGDEFALILPGAGEGEAGPTLDRVRAAIRSMDVPGGSLTACVGLAERHPGESQNELLDRADGALREAKGSPSPGSVRRASRAGHPLDRSAPSAALTAGIDRRRDSRALAGDIGLGIARQPDAGAGAAVAASELRDAIDLETCAVLRLGAESLEVVAAAGPDRPPTEWLELNHDSVGRALREKRSVLGGARGGPHGAARRRAREIAVPLMIGARAWGAIACRAPGDSLDELDATLIEAVAEHLSASIRAGDLLEQLTDSMIGTAEALAAAMEAKDSYTADHARSIAELAVAVGRELELPESAIDDLRYGAIFHDIGKIAVPDALINKPGPLTADEFDLVKHHPVTGAEILAPVPFLYGVRTIVRHAHEHWDGSGYPDGLAGAQIPLGARIVLAVDAFHAMTSNRPYRQALSDREACEELRRRAGEQFDPEVVEALLRVLEERSRLESANG